MERSALMLLGLRVAVLASASLCVLPASTLAQEPKQTIEGPLTPVAPRPLTNDSIVKMSRAGLGDDLILQTIDAQPSRFTTDPDALLALKGDGVSERVIARMVRKAASPGAVAAPAPISLPEVNEEGVYFKDKDGHWQEMAVERLRYQSGGWLKSTATYGVIKQDQNGHVDGRSSKLALTRPLDILIYAPQGTAAEEYEIVRFRVNSNSREFREETGGVFHKSSGAQRDDVPFTASKIGPQSYRLVLGPEDLGPGEFGVLPPGVVGQRSATGASKIYTFRINE